MPTEVNDVLQVTGLTPSTPVEPAAVPAAPSAPAEEAKPAEQPAAAEEVQDEQATAQAPDAPAAEATEVEEVSHETAPPKKPSRGVQKALDRLTEDRERERQRADQATAALQMVLLNQQRPQVAPQTQVAATDKAPDRAQFSDWEAYNRAVAQHEARQASTQMIRQELGNFVRGIVGQQQKQTADFQAAQMVKKVNDSVAKAPERFPDWDDVIASDAPVSPSLAHAISLSDDPAHVLRYLAVTQGEHDRVSRMSPAEQLVYIGRISAQVPPKAVVSSAPPPAKTVGGGRAATSPQYNENMTAEQHKLYMAKIGATRGLK